MANLLGCVSGSFQNGDQESKEEENLRIFRSLSALESQSPLCNSKINHDEGFYTRFALHPICLIFIHILKEAYRIF